MNVVLHENVSFMGVSVKIDFTSFGITVLAVTRANRVIVVTFTTEMTPGDNSVNTNVPGKLKSRLSTPTM